MEHISSVTFLLQRHSSYNMVQYAVPELWSEKVFNYIST